MVRCGSAKPCVRNRPPQSLRCPRTTDPDKPTYNEICFPQEGRTDIITVAVTTHSKNGLIMNAFWLKMAGLALLAVGVIVLVTVLTGPKTETKPEPTEKTIYDQWQQDEERLSAAPQYRQPTAPQQRPQTSTSSHIVQPGNLRQSPQPGPPTEPPKPQFKKLSPEDEIQAQRLWEWVKNQRKMGRLPVLGYKQMVDTCREIIRKWPQSQYAFYAKRALADLPPRYRKMYNVTDEEIDLGNLK